MSPTEAPPTPPPPSTEEELRPARRARGSRRSAEYSGLEGYDLLHVIDEIDDERARVALREKIWIALILHMLLFAYLIFAPKYIWHVKVRDSSTLHDLNKQITELDLPPDALKQLQRSRPAPKPAPPVQKAPEAPKRNLPPAPVPVPKTQLPPAPKPQPTPPQTAQQTPIPPKPQPVPVPAPSQSAQVEAPKPQPTKPNFNTGPQTAADAVQRAAREAAGGGTSGETGVNAPTQRGGNKGAVDILSDTLGVDFGPYIQRVIYATKRSWYPIVPEVAQPPISKQGKVLIRFKIMQDGSVKEMHLEGPSGDVSLDRAAWGGIVGAAPFPTLPKNFKGPFLELRFYFLYNDRDGTIR